MPQSWPRAVVFDLDGTLIDSVDDIAFVLNRMRKDRGLPPLEREAIKPLVSLGAKDILKNVLPDVTDFDEALAEFQKIYRTVPPNPASIFPHAVTMLQNLRDDGIAIGICTNKPEDNARRILAGLGLDPLLQAIVGKRDGLLPKPNPAPLYAALKQLDVSTGDAVYVGDNEVDAATALAAAVPFILVSFGYPTHRLDDIACAARIDDFSQLPGTLLTMRT